MSTISIPAGTAARLHAAPDMAAHGVAYAVILAPSHDRATLTAFLDTMTTPGGVSAILTHDPDVAWTDPDGEALLASTLARGGSVAMGFATLADAMACRRTLAGLGVPL